MAKYQFFVLPNTDRRQFTFLDSASETFLREKEQLIAQGFDVEDDLIYAGNEKEAVEKFKSNYISALEDYNASHPETTLASTIIELFRSAMKRINK
ncbi:hypothetical protein [Photobacterium alginatilyticum]|uniref:Uncharacterized protein n=1 Tax=Photobacterium alginatilyticum TaxID=1775171 RepID=A0ABW9YD17_9GAMM|nr:hypothetical protein [Photobacterium alginatilyticum]NBI51139.1 hypothetical protein [Photobacterium alginatilyticum]